MKLRNDVSASDTVIALSLMDTLTNLSSPGVITIGSEKIHFQLTDNLAFYGCTRGYQSTTAATHAAGTSVSLSSVDVQGAPTEVIVDVPAGGASVKEYSLNIDVEKDSPSTGDSNDAAIRITVNNRAVNDSNYIMRGINSGINNRAPGVVGTMDNAIGCQQKSGATATTMNGLSVHSENYGTLTTKMVGVDVNIQNEGAKATAEYGVNVRNTNNSLTTAADAALHVENAGTNHGFTTGLDLNGATLVNEMRFSNGTKVTVSGNTIVFTNAAGDKSSTITMS